MICTGTVFGFAHGFCGSWLSGTLHFVISVPLGFPKFVRISVLRMRGISFGPIYTNIESTSAPSKQC